MVLDATTQVNLRNLPRKIKNRISMLTFRISGCLDVVQNREQEADHGTIYTRTHLRCRFGRQVWMRDFRMLNVNARSNGLKKREVRWSDILAGEL